MKETSKLKSIQRIAGLIALVVAIGFTMAGCSDDPPPPPSGPIALTDNQWKHGQLTVAKPQIQYSFSAESTEDYYLWWNDSGQGDGLKTGDIKVSAKFDGENKFIFENIDSAWNSPREISWWDLSLSSKSKKVIITVELKNEDSFGTFGIVYKKDSGYLTPSRPGGAWQSPPATAIPLVENTWASGTIPDTSVTRWYSLNVTNGTAYRFWWSERNNPTGGIYTGNIVATGYYSDGTTAFAQTDTAWSSAKSFDSTKSGKLYVCVTLFNSSYPGSYGIVYSTSSTRPNVTLDGINAVQLTANTWKHGAISSASDTDWYKVSVTAGTTYRFWWSDRDNNSIHTADVEVTGYNNDQTVVSGFSNVDSAWTTAKSFTAAETGTLYLAVKLYSASYAGTYGIVYSESNTRPAMSLADAVVGATPLTADSWEDGVIAAGGVQWYTMQVTLGGTYRLWGNDSYSGNLVKTGRIYVAGFYSNGSAAFSSDSSPWASAKTITPGADDTVYIRVTPYDSTSAAGTYGIVYSAGATRPIFTYNPVGAVSLTMNEWKTDTIAAADGTKWYTISVTSGTSYYIFFNDSGNGNGTKTGNISVNAYYSDWAQVSNSLPVHSGWNSAISLHVASTGTVYIQIIPYSGSGSSASPYGSYAIVCATKNNRPLDVTGVTNSTALTEKQWETTGITPSGKWFSIAATAGSTYYFWYDTLEYGTGTMTARVDITVYDTENLFSFSQSRQNGWSTSTTPSITVTSNGTVYIFVEPYISSSIGTLGILYNTVNVRPLPESVTSSAVSLTSDTWTTSTLTAENKAIWYKFPVNSGTTYRIWWDGFFGGSGTMTADVSASAYYDTGVDIFSRTNSGYSSPRTFTSSSNGFVYVLIEPYSSNSSRGTGTFGVVFSTGSTMPAQ
ncbi:MAG: hypothetical protein LBH20_09245 [Treponema sp.]|nr:hypothetical protein [Treponema sp.]